MGLSGLLGFGLSKPKHGAAPGSSTIVAPTLSALPPTSAGTLITPPSVAQNAATAAAAAKGAAARVRKKASSVAGLPKPSGTVLAPVMQPKTLLGY